MPTSRRTARKGKNLVVFCDGTNNEFGENNTNVIKLLASTVRMSKGQMVFYDPGVGTFPAPGAWTPFMRWFTQLLGSAIGFGLQQNVALCYNFLVQNYEPGDRIYLFGFSRGAYTARVLAALIHVCGLLQTINPNLAGYALKLFRSEAVGAKKRNDRNEARTNQKQPLQLPVCSHFRETFSITPTPKVHFLGVWDTVSSVGMIYNPFKLPYTRWNPSVEVVRHAVSIDERRKFFRTNLWSTGEQETDVQQVWFAGVHADVGGGYPETESGLARLSLAWMAGEASRFGLEIEGDRLEAMMSALEGIEKDTDRQGCPVMHDELRKPFWKLAQWIPRRAWRRDPDTRRYVEYWNFSPTPQSRFIEDGSWIHGSVFDLMKHCPDYRPQNLPEVALDEHGNPVSR